MPESLLPQGEVLGAEPAEVLAEATEADPVMAVMVDPAEAVAQEPQSKEPQAARAVVAEEPAQGSVVEVARAVEAAEWASPARNPAPANG